MHAISGDMVYPKTGTYTITWDVLQDTETLEGTIQFFISTNKTTTNYSNGEVNNSKTKNKPNTNNVELSSYYKSISFNLNQIALDTKIKSKLDGIASLLIQYSDSKFNVNGHTYDMGNSKKSIKVSNRMVENVINYLISRGVNPMQLIGNGFGDTMPINTNSTLQGKKDNNRIEIYLAR